MKKRNYLVSIAIPTWNSAKTLRKTLESIKKQTYSPVEIIVADGESKDNTVEIAKEYGAKICFGKELAKARHEALKKAKGMYLLQLDSDQFIGRDLVERCVRTIEKNNLDALIIYEQSLINQKNTMLELFLAFDKRLVSRSKDAHPVFGAAIPRFFKRKLLLSMQWPKNISILDDAILFEKNSNILKHVGFLEGKGIMHHEVGNWKTFFKKFVRYGELYIPTLKVSSRTTLGHSLPRRVYVSTEVFFHPKVFVGLATLYLVKAVAVLTGIMVYLLRTRFRPK